MARAAFQRDLCRLIASSRIAQGESSISGGAALGVATGSPRISRDVDLFHDTDEALIATWSADRSGTADLARRIRTGALRFHEGSIRGSFPQIVERGEG